MCVCSGDADCGSSGVEALAVSTCCSATATPHSQQVAHSRTVALPWCDGNAIQVPPRGADNASSARMGDARRSSAGLAPTESGAVVTHEYVTALERKCGTRTDVQVRGEVHDRLQKARLHEPAARRIPSCHDFDSIASGRSSLSANACKLVQAWGVSRSSGMSRAQGRLPITRLSAASRSGWFPVSG